MALRKTDKANIRKRYPIFVEVGLIIALVVLITAFRVRLNPESDFKIVQPEQATVQLKEVQQTRQQMQPPPPPRPPVPVEVPNDQVLEDTDLNLDATLDFSESLEQTPPPPPPDPEPEQQEPEIFMVVEQMPEIIGGMASIYEHIEYPEFARKAGIEGTVFVQFTVDEQGNVSNVVIQRGVHELLDQEALRAVRQLQFRPGKQRGQAVKVRMSLPVRFRLQ